MAGRLGSGGGHRGRAARWRGRHRPREVKDRRLGGVRAGMSQQQPDGARFVRRWLVEADSTTGAAEDRRRVARGVRWWNCSLAKRMHVGRRRKDER